MRRGLLALAALAVAALASACMTPGALSERQRRNEELQQQIHKDILGFYENMAQAYYVLAYDCFLLGEDARAAKNEALAQQYAKKSELYKRYSEDLRASLKTTRESLEQMAGPETGKIKPFEAPVSPPPESEPVRDAPM